MTALASKAAENAGRCSTGKPGEVLAVDVAAAKALRTARPVHETEHLPLIEAPGRISAAAAPVKIRSAMPSAV